MKVGQSPSLTRNSVAKVVLPAPLEPAIIRMFFSESVYLAGATYGAGQALFTLTPSPLPSRERGYVE